MENSKQITNSNDDSGLRQWVIIVLLILIFLLLLGICISFFSGSGSRMGASVIDAIPPAETRSVDTRLSELEREISGLKAPEAPAVAPVATPSNPNPAPVAPAKKYLRIGKFDAGQTNIPSGSVINFTYAGENLSSGVSYRLLLQCPAGVNANSSTGVNLCRRTIADSIAIDNTGSYSVTFTNYTADNQVVIAALLAYDMTEGNIFLRDSRVVPITVRPSTQNSNAYSGDQTITLNYQPVGGTAPVTISFSATVNNLTSCVPVSWSFGDSYQSNVSNVCPNPNESIKARVVMETHTYNLPGVYTAALVVGGKTATANIYVGGNTQTTYNPVYTNGYSNYYQQPQTIYYTQPSYYQQPATIYYTQPQPTYYPSVPNVPTSPLNLRAASTNGRVNLVWDAPTLGNVGNYVVYRIGGNSLPSPISGNISPCQGPGTATCYYTVAGNTTVLSDVNVTAVSTYTYRVVAFNDNGGSVPSDSLSISIAGQTIPNAPQTFTASVSGTRVLLSWTAPTSGGSLSGYALYRKGGSSLPTPSPSGINNCINTDGGLCQYLLTSSSLGFTDLNVANDTTYTYRLVAIGTSGVSTPTDSLTVIIGPAALPLATPVLNPAQRVDAASVINLSWTSVGGSYYRVFRTTNRAEEINENATAGCAANSVNGCFVTYGGLDRIYGLTAADTQYEQPRTYYYRVKAYGVTGVSAWSNEITVIPAGSNGGGNAVLPTPDPYISGFNVNGQTTPTVNSGSNLLLQYSGTYVSAWKLFAQCPQNVNITDKLSGANLCRTNIADAVSVTAGGNYEASVFNMTNTDQTIALTLAVYRSNGALGQSVTRNVIVRPQAGNTTPSVVVTPTATASFASSEPVVPHVIPEGAVWLMCKTTNQVSQSILRPFTTDQNGGDKRYCSPAWTDYMNGAHRYRFGCYGPNDRSSVDGSLLMGSPRIFSCEEVTSSGAALNPTNVRSITKTCAAGDVTTPGSEVACTGRPAATTPPAANPPVTTTPEPVINAFTVNGQTAPTVASASAVQLTYGGANVSAYKLFLRCPNNVSSPELGSGANLCRSDASAAVSLTAAGNYTITLVNLTGVNQTVVATLQALRTNGTIGATVERNISVIPQAGL